MFAKFRSSSKKKYPTVRHELCRQFSLDDLKKATNNFDEEQKIGKSGYNEVYYKGYLKHNGETDYPIALKRMRYISEVWRFEEEVELHCQIHHPNLISLIGFCHQKDVKINVYEHMFNGSLYDHLRSRDMESFSWKKRLEICIGVAKGLHYLHTGAKRTIIHRGIKPQSILLDNRMVPKLFLDKSMVPKLSHRRLFSKAKLSTSKPEPIESDRAHGTSYYMAPELFSTNTYSDKSDVYAFGMVLLEVACTNNKHTVFDKMRMLNTFYPAALLESFRADEMIDPFLMRLIAPQCLTVFMDIMKKCLNREPNERPIMGEVEVELEHALALQVEADDGKSNGGDYNFFATTIPT